MITCWTFFFCLSLYIVVVQVWEATVGIYNFSRGDNFCKAANTMIKKDKRVNGEFYVAPVYNELINEKYNVGFFNIGAVNNGMYGLGTPDDLNYFKSQLISINF